jgi:UDP-galactopyranose mutase
MSTHSPQSKSLESIGAGIKFNFKPDLVCFSHLRWDFVHQRPQHLLSRAAKDRRVFFIEEPVFDTGTMRLEVAERENGLQLVVPHLPDGLRSQVAANVVLRDLVQRLFLANGVVDFVAWYYTPMALSFTADFTPRSVVYDCMDELSAFKGAHEKLGLFERELFRMADLVFTGGQSLYESKREQHDSVYCFPSSIDRDHFMQARSAMDEPEDQKEIPRPRLGFFGVIDERFDSELLKTLAQARPDWQFVMLGPVVKIDPASLYQSHNVHYLGGKSYQDLPAYISGWDVALMPFAQNDATRFISPTKTPEYLSAGKRVVSSPINDVVHPYGDLGLVEIAGHPDDFITCISRSLEKTPESDNWIDRTDAFLSDMSWDLTWSRMSQLIDEAVEKKRRGDEKSVEVLTRQAGVAGS